MGRDKALLRWESEQILDHLIATLQCLESAPVLNIIGDREPYHGRGAAVIADDYPGVGPLGGIATALRRCGAEKVLVVAVDMPCLSVDLLNAMVAYRFDGDALIPQFNGYQPLHAIYRRTCLPAIERHIDANALRISDLFGSIDVTYLDEGWIITYDPDGRSFVNVNTPGELQDIRAGIFDDVDARR